MPSQPTHTDKIEHPEIAFGRPGDILADTELSLSEKRQALKTWEVDLREKLTSADEGMIAEDARLEAADRQLQEVERALEQIGK